MKLVRALPLLGVALFSLLVQRSLSRQSEASSSRLRALLRALDAQRRSIEEYQSSLSITALRREILSAGVLEGEPRQAPPRALGENEAGAK